MKNLKYRFGVRRAHPGVSGIIFRKWVLPGHKEAQRGRNVTSAVTLAWPEALGKGKRENHRCHRLIQLPIPWMMPCNQQILNNPYEIMGINQIFDSFLQGIGNRFFFQ